MDFESMVRELTSRWGYVLSTTFVPQDKSDVSVDVVAVKSNGDGLIKKTIKLENINNGVFLILREVRQKEGAKPHVMPGLKG